MRARRPGPPVLCGVRGPRGVAARTPRPGRARRAEGPSHPTGRSGGPGGDRVVRGSAGTGVLYAAVHDISEVELLRAMCVRAGGHATVLTAPDDVRDILDMWGPVPGLALMRRIKDQFDPDHRFAPGRFVGGI